MSHGNSISLSISAKGFDFRILTFFETETQIENQMCQKDVPWATDNDNIFVNVVQQKQTEQWHF